MTLTAHRTALSDEGVSWSENECFARTYRRHLPLSDDIDAEHIVTSYDHGVLTVTLPITEKAKPRRIEVSTGPPTHTETTNEQAQIAA